MATVAPTGDGLREQTLTLTGPAVGTHMELAAALARDHAAAFR